MPFRANAPAHVVLMCVCVFFFPPPFPMCIFHYSKARWPDAFPMAKKEAFSWRWRAWSWRRRPGMLLSLSHVLFGKKWSWFFFCHFLLLLHTSDCIPGRRYFPPRSSVRSWTRIYFRVSFIWTTLVLLGPGDVWGHGNGKGKLWTYMVIDVFPRASGSIWHFN